MSIRSFMPVTLSLALGLSLVAACDKNQPETANTDDAVKAEPDTDSDSGAAKREFPDLDSVLASDHRPAENSVRDSARHPKETLEFFGIARDMTVVELWPGGGWYTEILGPYLRDEGQLIVTNWPADHERYGASAKKFTDKLAAAPDIFGTPIVVTSPITPDQPFVLAPEGTVDLVVTFRNSHGWYNGGQTAQIYAAAFAALKPGGIFGIVQHRANEGTDPATTAKDGYLPESQVIEAAKAVGFELVEKSEINGNPKDTKDHPAGVWSLPPSLSGPDDKDLTEAEKAKFIEIGESDRMTLKFRKPA